MSFNGLGHLAGCCCNTTPTCAGCRLPTGALTVTWTNALLGKESTILYRVGDREWSSCCANQIVFRLECVDGVYHFSAAYYTSGDCPSGSAATCMSPGQSPYGLTPAGMLCEAAPGGQGGSFVLYYTLNSGSCPTLASQGYTKLTITGGFVNVNPPIDCPGDEPSRCNYTVRAIGACGLPLAGAMVSSPGLFSPTPTDENGEIVFGINGPITGTLLITHPRFYDWTGGYSCDSNGTDGTIVANMSMKAGYTACFCGTEFESPIPWKLPLRITDGAGTATLSPNGCVAEVCVSRTASPAGPEQPYVDDCLKLDTSIKTLVSPQNDQIGSGTIGVLYKVDLLSSPPTVKMTTREAGISEYGNLGDIDEDCNWNTVYARRWYVEGASCVPGETTYSDVYTRTFQAYTINLLSPLTVTFFSPDGGDGGWGPVVVAPGNTTLPTGTAFTDSVVVSESP